MELDDAALVRRSRGHRKAAASATKPPAVVADLMARIGERLKQDRENAVRLRATIAARQATATQERQRQVERWLQTRRHLLGVVRELDEAFAPFDLALCLVDEAAPAGLIGAIEIRLSRLHAGTEAAVLDISIATDGQQSVRAFGDGSVRPLGLPAIERATPDDYRRLILGFVERVLLHKGEAVVLRCARCGEPVAA